MQIALRRVDYAEKQILANLLEKYNYEFSQYDGRELNALGLFGYRYLDHYWTDRNRWAYFIEADGKLAGFVMINGCAEAQDRPCDYSIAEFFVMYKYRRAGVGRQAFVLAADSHRGKWQLKMHPKNLAAKRFWERVVPEYAGAKCELVRDYPHTVPYVDGSPGDIFFFDNRKLFWR